MKFVVDEDISHRTIKFLNELGYDVKGVPEHLKGSDDETIVTLAIEEGRPICDYFRPRFRSDLLFFPERKSWNNCFKNPPADR